MLLPVIRMLNESLSAIPIPVLPYMSELPLTTTPEDPPPTDIPSLNPREVIPLSWAFTTPSSLTPAENGSTLPGDRPLNTRPERLILLTPFATKASISDSTSINVLSPWPEICVSSHRDSGVEKRKVPGLKITGQSTDASASWSSIPLRTKPATSFHPSGALAAATTILGFLENAAIDNTPIVRSVMGINAEALTIQNITGLVVKGHSSLVDTPE